MLREIILEDNNGNQATIFFMKKSFQVASIKKDKRFLTIGKPNIKYGKISFRYPEMIPSANPNQPQSEQKTALEDYQAGRLYPIYPEMMGIKSSWFAKKTRWLMESIEEYAPEHLPQKMLGLFQLMDIPTSIRQMHYPDTFESKAKAQERIIFDRLLRVQLHAKLFKHRYAIEQEKIDDNSKIIVTKKSNKKNTSETNKKPEQQSLLTTETTAESKKTIREKNEKTETERTNTTIAQVTNDQKVVIRPHRETIKEIVKTLPFTLTWAQKRVVKEMVEDIHQPEPMLRLLQGDVGSGKTVVAAIISYYVIKQKHWQVAFLAPLAILAHQHYQNMAKLLLPLGIRVEYIAGAVTKSQKNKIKADLEQGKIDMIVGTHALIQDDVRFQKLSLAIVDEQHKFGVKQRWFFKKRGSPHLIQMSATPIPRSLALAFFGEFDVSVIDEMPAGRKEIVTKIVKEKEMKKLKARFLTKIQQGQKLFVVTPLIEESEKMEGLKAATTERENMCDLFPELSGQIALLHGKINAKEKDAIMKAFKEGKFKILVATTVIEVGVDIKEATMMVIKNAERFGLSQLHQLRGRIGRNDLQSYCFLETQKTSGDTLKRLKAMEETNDGFKLAEIDLQYRWSGEILGTRQSGETDIPYEYLTNMGFVNKVQTAAERLIEHYPNLEGLSELQKKLQSTLSNIMV